ncbi:MAG: M20/M25/M40 family metallo-hydrolase [Terrimonas sp.]|nr:M20/M25/M40 family metallo-hydrolase [Terrimonas sp.]
MKKFLVSVLLGSTPFLFYGQLINKMINTAEVSRIENYLASDELKGRKTFSAELDQAAGFIAEEFRQAGLSPLAGQSGYRQEFVMVQPRFISAAGVMDNEAVEAKNIIVVTCKPVLKINEQSGYEKRVIGSGENLFAAARQIQQSNKDLLVLVNTSFASQFGRLAGLKRGMFKTNHSVVFVLTDKDPAVYSFEAVHEITERKLCNVVGVIPGKSRKDEMVIFSGHYDHLGVGKPVEGDSIYNGANDDAAGTTAVILLAKYFKALGNNERTLVFAAFTAEEVGAFGSQYFSKQLAPDKVVAMFNIEMIGTDSKWGKNSAYITGYDKTDMGSILQQNLSVSDFRFYPDPYTQQNLFYRSDNATLARLGVPAHTISTSKMDNEPNYHKVSDEVSTLDLDNMTEIIKAIAISAGTIISGKDTPARVKVSDLN